MPDLASLIALRLGQVAYAVYSGRSAAPRGWEDGHLDRDKLRALSWCGFDEYHGYMPGQAWLHDLLGENRPMVRVNNWLVLHELVRAGVAVAVLPCCFGDADPLLVRLTEVLPDVSADQFLLVHRDLHTLHGFVRSSTLWCGCSRMSGRHSKGSGDLVASLVLGPVDAPR